MQDERRTPPARIRLAGESGQAMVEMALVLPIFLILVAGMLDFGRALNFWNDETHLANIAARWASVGTNPGAPGTTLEEYVALQATARALRGDGDARTDVSDSVDPVEVTICATDGPDAGTDIGAGDEVRATVSTEYSWYGVIGMTVLTTDLVGEATMRLEYRPPTGELDTCAV